MIRERRIDNLSNQASALYLFLVTVGDNQGLSYYGNKTLGKRLGMNMSVLSEARNALVQHQLIAYREPLYQVLSLDIGREPVQADSNTVSIGKILQQMIGDER